MALTSSVIAAPGVMNPQAPLSVPTWRYTTETPPDGWQKPGFNDKTWKVGQAPFGKYFPHIGTNWDTPEIYLRGLLTLTRPVQLPLATVKHDDGAEVYIDGTLAVNANAGGDTFLILPAARSLLKAGTHTIAVHCHNILGPQMIDVRFQDLGYLHAAAVPTRDTFSDTWVATDALGRAVADRATAGAPRAHRTVGVFYFLANHVTDTPVYDITKLLAQNPADPQYGPLNAPHWWSQPWLGYYQSNDEAIIRTHLQMLSDAGVDVIIFDNTNGPTYPDVYLTICKVMEQMRAEGCKTPQLAFFAGHGAWQTLYRDFYSQNLFPDLWYRWQGKPLMLYVLNSGEILPSEISQFFTTRYSWAWSQGEWFGDGQHKWPWLDNYPQNYGWDTDPQVPEEMAVEVAQHATTSIGRSSLAQVEPAVNELRLTPDTAKGLCFAQQFERALKIAPPFLFITGWNEWTAGHYTDDSPHFAGKPHVKGGAIFVDEYNEEFSRDIEPEQGRLQDNYYYQFVNYVRRYKGVRTLPPVTAKTITLSGGFVQWRSVGPEYRDDRGDPVHRNNDGWDKLRYVNTTGRNDIVAAKVSYDKSNVYFYAQTVQKLTPHTGKSWMLLYLNTDGDAKTGWLGYDYVVNRQVGVKTTSLQKNVGGQYQWGAPTAIKYQMGGDALVVAVPRKLLGPKLPSAIDFKWADNVQQTGQVSDFTLNGDAAPNGRFNYRATLKR